MARPLRVFLAAFGASASVKLLIQIKKFAMMDGLAKTGMSSSFPICSIVPRMTVIVKSGSSKPSTQRFGSGRAPMP